MIVNESVFMREASNTIPLQNNCTYPTPWLKLALTRKRNVRSVYPNRRSENPLCLLFLVRLSEPQKVEHIQLLTGE